MQLLQENQVSSLALNVTTIGFFDGVHRGHQDLIHQVQMMAKERGLSSLLVTFNNHPCTVLRADKCPSLLSTPDEKFHLLAQTNIETCVSLHFTEELSQLSAHDFMEQYLLKKFNTRTLVIGYDHHFGKPSGESFTEYMEYGKRLGIEVIKAREFLFQGKSVSSSIIRQFLAQGNVTKAIQLLGHPYIIEGEVVHGKHIGHRLGFPTANLQPERIGKLLPADGSYAVRVEVGGNNYAGMLYLGDRPTFNNLTKKTMEVHLLHFNQNIYGQRIRIDFVERMRPSQHFATPEELSRQLQQDLQLTAQLVQL